ncbi:MAG: Type 1 glutamine amidotransferase-like domain-containing protein [Lysobacterales bacterium]
MATQILLGPQTPTPNIRQAIESINTEGPVVVITAGWRDSEGEIDELRDSAGCPVEDLMLYHRAEEVFAHEPGLRELQRERQDKLTELQRLYRIRLAPTLTAARKLLRTRAEPELLRLEQRAAITQLRALDTHQLRRIQAIHQNFNQRRAGLEIPRARAQRDAVHSLVEKAGLVLIAGGHVAVLLNRIRLFGLDQLLAQKPVIAWSAGAMALSERIVLFHHDAPQGKRDAELLDAGLGIVRRRVLLPHASTRLDWHNRRRMALFSRRFSPSVCCTLDNGSMIHLDNDRVVASAGSYVVMRTGRKKTLTAAK